MIFVILGSQKFQFDRLLQKIDCMIEDGIITEEVFAQTGYSQYIPRNYQYEPFLDRTTFEQMTEKSRLIITHCGTGSIMSGVRSGKYVIAVPRREKYGEHVNDHQLQILKQFDEMNLICPCYDLQKLDQLYQKVETMQFRQYKHNTELFIHDVDQYLCHIGNGESR